MPNKPRKIARATIMGLLLASAPVASALGQQMDAAHVFQAEPQQTSPEPVPVPEPASIISAAAAAEVDAARTRMMEAAREASRFEEKAAALKPGQFLWHPERSATGDVEMVVSLAEQKAYVFRGGKLIAVTTVSTGKRGHRTPTGSFTILQKARRHFSSTYNNAPMPNMQRLTWKGIALHAGALPGYPASHGCVRLPLTFSRNLFGATRLGGRVHIIAGKPEAAADALALATGRGGGTAMASAR